MRPDRAPIHAFARDVVQATSCAIALPGGEHERDIPRAAGRVKALGERDQQRLGHPDPDEAAYRQRVPIEDQSGGLVSSDDLRAPRGPNADRGFHPRGPLLDEADTGTHPRPASLLARSCCRSSYFWILPVEVRGSAATNSIASGALKCAIRDRT